MTTSFADFMKAKMILVIRVQHDEAPSSAGDEFVKDAAIGGAELNRGGSPADGSGRLCQNARAPQSRFRRGAHQQRHERS
jgi:hypothetical protein